MRTAVFVLGGVVAMLAAYFLSSFLALLIGFRDLLALAVFQAIFFPAISAIFIVLLARLFRAVAGGRYDGEGRIAIAAMGLSFFVFAIGMALIFHGVATPREALAVCLVPLAAGMVFVRRLV